MKIVTYLAFTLLSIVVNFALMDFIQEKIRFGNHSVPDINASSIKTPFEDVLKHYGKKPHALYYRTHMRLEKNSPILKTYSNTSVLESFETSTDISSTMIDLFYEENSSITEDSYTTATESLLTTSEYDNVTEITFFGRKNTTTSVPSTIKPKKTTTKDCSCNLLFQVCDVNCCCDNDCTDNDREIFTCTSESAREQADGCVSHLSFSSYLTGTGLENLFCIVKSNLPDRRKLNNFEHDDSRIAKVLKWNSKNAKSIPVHEFSRKTYEGGDPVWILKNGSIYYIDLPAQNFNNYCSTRKPMKFLRNEKVTCNVKLSDLEIFHTLYMLEGSTIISVTNKSANSSSLNCSTLHCTEWTIIFCNDMGCEKYNKSMHESLCTESVCTNIARRVDYTFQYHESKITNATIKLFTQKLFLNVPFVDQEVNVKFILTNVSVDKIIEFSGNPGYKHGLPVIVSGKKSNYSDNFFNGSAKVDKFISHPENKNGICITSNITSNFMLFGHNRKTKCRLLLKYAKNPNATEFCKNIQKSVIEMLDLDKRVVAPYGNPQNIKDEEWILFKMDEIENPLYGIYKQSNVQCYNILVGVSYIFVYADASKVDTKRENKILGAKIEKNARNVTFNIEDMSTVISVDTMFIDVTKPSEYEYAGGPHLNIHLPKDFFFPFLSNTASVIFKCNFLFTMTFTLIALQF